MNKELQADIFNMFHDGLIQGFKRKNENIELEVYIPYLASLIYSTFSTFSVKLINCKDIYAEVFGEEANFVKDFDILSSAELEILTSKHLNATIQVTCASTELGKGFGAVLVIETEDILIYDESGDNISVVELEQLCDKY